MRTTLLFVVALATSGCTAAKANIQLVNAEQALLRARGQGAENLAQYEFTMAQRYLEKAGEEAGYSEFRIADALARQSAEWSDRAIIFMEKRGMADINLDDFSNVPDVAPPPAPETVPPPPDDGLEEILAPAPVPIPGTVPGTEPGDEGEGDEFLDELFGDPPPADGDVPPPPPDDTPVEEDFEMDDEIEFPE